MPGRGGKRNQYGDYNNYGYSNERKGSSTSRNHVVPNEPPFTAYIGNVPTSMVQGDFENLLFTGLKVKQVRLVRDRHTDQSRGFAYVDFEDAESLSRAIELDGTPVNGQHIRIDVAARPLGAKKSPGFRNKPDFEAHHHRRQLPENNDSRSYEEFRHDRRAFRNYNQQETLHNRDGGHEADENDNEDNHHRLNSNNVEENRHSQSQHYKTPPRKSSNDDVFVAPDTPASNEGINEQMKNEQEEVGIIRQRSRNWADCPIDETVTEPSPPASVNNTFHADDFQVVRNRNPKSRASHQQQSRPMSNKSSRGRNNQSSHQRRDESSPMSGRHNYYDLSQQYHHRQQTSPSQHMASYHMSHNNNRNQHSAGSRQRLNSNRSNTSRHFNDNNERTHRGNDENSNDIDNNPVPAENRPRLNLLPRSQTLSTTSDDAQATEPSIRNTGIFGCGKPRDERDPKLAQLDKHIEEVVEKEQHFQRTTSTTSNESKESVIKPVKILAAKK